MSAPSPQPPGSTLRRAIAPLVVLPFLIGGWYVLKWTTGLPDYVIPGPLGVVRALHEHRATLVLSLIHI